MREKYETLSLATLKDLAKARGLKGVSGMKKAELIERMLEEDERDRQATPEETKSAAGDRAPGPGGTAPGPRGAAPADAADRGQCQGALRQHRRQGDPRH